MSHLCLILFLGVINTVAQEPTRSLVLASPIELELSGGHACLHSATNGANGDFTNLVLPGGIYVGFSGHDVRHADGRQLQRVGIQPHIKVEPTPRGIREGRDEVLEAAVKYLDSALKK